MEWLTAVRSAIDYMEENLDRTIAPADVARHVHSSPYLFTKGFAVMTGYSVSDYLRCRRLYRAALALRETGRSVLEIALDAGYDTPESFAKAFARFHGSTPTAVRNGGAFRTFLPLRLQITVQGGDQMDCKITKMFGLKLIGFQKEFDVETAQTEIPRFWDEICAKYAANVYAGNPPANPWEQALVDNCIGEYAVCIDDLGADRFRYLLAGRYTGGPVPAGMEVYEFPMGEWAVFDCVGPVPGAIQAMNERIFKQWLPGNKDYELCGNATVEWYDCIHGEMTDPDYRSAVWIPVKRKA